MLVRDMSCSHELTNFIYCSSMNMKQVSTRRRRAQNTRNHPRAWQSEQQKQRRKMRWWLRPSLLNWPTSRRQLQKPFVKRQMHTRFCTKNKFWTEHQNSVPEQSIGVDENSSVTKEVPDIQCQKTISIPRAITYVPLHYLLPFASLTLSVNCWRGRPFRSCMR